MVVETRGVRRETAGIATEVILSDSHPNSYPNNQSIWIPSTLSFFSTVNLTHTSIGCGKQGFPSAQPYLSHTGELIVGWMTTSESSLFSFFASHQRHSRMSAI
ncbi:hypothetical protein N7487_001940 [Penicillium crustosum]|nr:hypothetical protein N7487_001940 [Penicillium crustosum]